MKKCTYCGGEYADETEVCPADHQRLGGPSSAHDSTASEKEGQKGRVYVGAVICITIGIAQIFGLFESPRPGLSADVAKAIFLKNVGIGIVMVGAGIWLLIRKKGGKRG